MGDDRRHVHGRTGADLPNQDIWIANWGGRFFNGRGIPGQTDEPETTAAGDTDGTTATGNGTATGNETATGTTNGTAAETDTPQ